MNRECRPRLLLSVAFVPMLFEARGRPPTSAGFARRARSSPRTMLRHHAARLSGVLSRDDARGLGAWKSASASPRSSPARRLRRRQGAEVLGDRDARRSVDVPRARPSRVRAARSRSLSCPPASQLRRRGRRARGVCAARRRAGRRGARDAWLRGADAARGSASKSARSVCDHDRILASTSDTIDCHACSDPVRRTLSTGWRWRSLVAGRGIAPDGRSLRPACADGRMTARSPDRAVAGCAGGRALARLAIDRRTRPLASAARRLRA